LLAARACTARHTRCARFSADSSPTAPELILSEARSGEGEVSLDGSLVGCCAAKLIERFSRTRGWEVEKPEGERNARMAPLALALPASPRLASPRRLPALNSSGP
jgi:hypothetical protein